LFGAFAGPNVKGVVPLFLKKEEVFAEEKAKPKPSRGEEDCRGKGRLSRGEPKTLAVLEEWLSQKTQLIGRDI